MNNLKVKPLTKEQILISFDRLTRFKHPEVKYLRVFYDVLTNNLISPKYKKFDLEKMDYRKIKDLAQYVFNFSINELGYGSTEDYLINQRLYDYEKSVFKLSENTEELLKNKIHYKAVLDFIDENSSANSSALLPFCNPNAKTSSRCPANIERASFNPSANCP